MGVGCMYLFMAAGTGTLEHGALLLDSRLAVCLVDFWFLVAALLPWLLEQPAVQWLRGVWMLLLAYLIHSMEAGGEGPLGVARAPACGWLPGCARVTGTEWRRDACRWARRRLVGVAGDAGCMNCYGGAGMAKAGTQGCYGAGKSSCRTAAPVTCGVAGAASRRWLFRC